MIGRKLTAIVYGSRDRGSPASSVYFFFEGAKCCELFSSTEHISIAKTVRDWPVAEVAQMFEQEGLTVFEVKASDDHASAAPSVTEWAERFRARWAGAGPRVAPRQGDPSWCAQHGGVWILGISIGAQHQAAARAAFEGTAFRPLLEQCPGDLRVVLFIPRTDSLILAWDLVPPTYLIQQGRHSSTGNPPVLFPPP